MTGRRVLLFSVTKDDFDVQTFRAGGKGGQHQNKTESGVRIVHRASGAVGEARDDRSQHANKKLALRRLLDTPRWRMWHAAKVQEMLSGETVEDRVAKQMAVENLKIETRVDNKWVPLVDAASSEDSP